MKKRSLLCTFILVLLLAGCSAVDPAEEAVSIDERRLFDEATDVHTLAGTAMDNPKLVAGEGDEIHLEVGQRVSIPSLDATLAFVQKTADSRCPADVICVWEGAATVLLEFTPSGQPPTQFEIGGFIGGNGYQHGERNLIHEAFGLRFTLLRLDPYPLINVEQTDPVTVMLRVETL